MKQKVDLQNAQIEKLICENDLLKGQMSQVLEDQNVLDNKQRKCNLVFEGVNETKGENVRQVIKDLIEKVSEDQGITKEVDAAYRIGKKATGKSRPIIVVFKNLVTRDTVLSKASIIKRKADNKNLWINKDLTDLSRQRNTTVRRCFNRLKDKKVKCQIQGPAIKLNGKDYGHNDLESLPEGSRPSDCQTVIYDESSICFAGAKAYYSNFYPATVRYHSRCFTSSEQAFQWRKAQYHSDAEAERKILETSDPYKIKRESSAIETSKEWTLEEEGILHEIVREKFIQNKDLLRRFREEPYTKYYECTTDNKWGCGFHLDAINIDTEELRGKNRLENFVNNK